MNIKETLARINELANKEKETSLTTEEKAEQKHLRQAYLGNIRESFTSQFETMKVVDPEGTDVTPEKVKDIQKRNKLN